MKYNIIFNIYIIFTWFNVQLVRYLRMFFYNTGGLPHKQNKNIAVDIHYPFKALPFIQFSLIHFGRLDLSESRTHFLVRALP